MAPSPPRSPPPATAEEMQTYKPLFRRRKPPISEPPVPCLRCAIVDMHCVYYRGEVKCQRCERNGEEFCLFQRQDLTKPETRLTRQQQEQLDEEERERKKAAPPPRHSWLVTQPPAAPRPEPLQCMVYSKDPALARDTKRLLAAAAEMLRAAVGDGATMYVHGQPVLDADARNFVLPNWTDLADWREKRDSSPEYRQRAAFFEGLAAENAEAAARSRRLGQERRRKRELSADKKRKEREEAEAEAKEAEAKEAGQ